MQEILKSYNSGIQITAVKLQDVNPPDKVRPAFNEVNAAQQDRERFINTALEDYNKVIPRARTNTAKGDATRFVQIWTEYEQSKDVTRRRLYLENLGKILPKLEKKYIVDENVNSILPLLKLGEE